MNQTSSLPIGFIDSGLGGISVLREAIKIMPSENFIYYGDSANAPYGTKPREEIRALTFRVVDILLARGVKGIAVACNTATGAAVRDLRGIYPDLPIVGIEPAIKPAVEQSHGGRILVLATPMTISQDKFRNLLARYNDNSKIIAVPCKGLMEFVEQGILEGEILDRYFDEHLLPYINEETESIVLGCTHYPFLRHHLNGYLKGRNIALIDGSLGTAKELKRRLGDRNLLLPAGEPGKVEILNSSDDPQKIILSHKLLELPDHY